MDMRSGFIGGYVGSALKVCVERMYCEDVLRG